MILITGAAGFIGSCLLAELNGKGISDLVIADDFTKAIKKRNYEHKDYKTAVPRDQLAGWLEVRGAGISCVFHLGARTDTTEFDPAIFDRLNFSYSKQLWKFCCENRIPFIYASSAATYGAGEKGYDDNTPPHDLKPLNPYGDSKNEFDQFVMDEIRNGRPSPPLWYGLKFFNVYGPNEFHKGRMASVIFHAFNQLKQNGSVKLFKSHRPDFKDGFQKRDFIYVKDVVKVLEWMREKNPPSGIYNLGTGRARTFYDLANATARAMQIDLKVDWIDIPGDIRDTYQYFTEAKMDKLFNAGYDAEFYSLEDGIKDYVVHYLANDQSW